MCLAIVVAGASCVGHDIGEPACGVRDPVEELPWLKEIVLGFESGKGTDTYPYFYVTQGQIDGVTVFVIENCCPFCNTVRVAYTCEGEALQPLHYSTVVENEKIIWRPDDFQCAGI